MPSVHTRDNPSALRFAAALIGALLLAFAHAPRTAAQVLPSGFEFTDINGPFSSPVGVAVASDGRIFVAQQDGIVRVIEDNALLPTPFIDLRAEVGFDADRGLLGIALDPDFLANRRVYLLYTLDPVPGEPNESGEVPSFGRLTRYEGTAPSNGNVADLATRTVLLGAAPGGTDGVPICYTTHTIGCLAFGTDGSLFVSTGDGAHFFFVDPGGTTPGCVAAAEDIGAFRSQMLDSLAGKMLRIDPATGLGFASNPFYTGNAAHLRSKLWATGLRNPFRFCVRPGSPAPGTIYTGDVGWYTWEEISVITPPLPGQPGRNLGWPCREGGHESPDYPGVDLPAWDCATIGTRANPGPLVEPIVDWHHSDANLSNPPGYVGAASTGGEFYQGTTFPPAYHGCFFFTDFVAGWIRVLRMNAADQIQHSFLFAEGGNDMVDIAADPLNGDLILVSKFTNTVRRISFTGKVGDTNNDVIVGIGDLLAVIGAWGPCTEPGPLSCPEDITIDGVIGIADLLAVIGNWG